MKLINGVLFQLFGIIWFYVNLFNDYNTYCSLELKSEIHWFDGTICTYSTEIFFVSQLCINICVYISFGSVGLKESIWVFFYWFTGFSRNVIFNRSIRITFVYQCVIGTIRTIHLHFVHIAQCFYVRNIQIWGKLHGTIFYDN